MHLFLAVQYGDTRYEWYYHFYQIYLDICKARYDSDS